MFVVSEQVSCSFNSMLVASIVTGQTKKNNMFFFLFFLLLKEKMILVLIRLSQSRAHLTCTHLHRGSVWLQDPADNCCTLFRNNSEQTLTTKNGRPCFQLSNTWHVTPFFPKTPGCLTLMTSQPAWTLLGNEEWYGNGMLGLTDVCQRCHFWKTLP